jgi:stage II sporulation protein D
MPAAAVEPGGPDVEVRIAAAPAIRLHLPGPVEVRAGAGRSLFRGLLSPDPRSAVTIAAAEAGGIRIGDLWDAGPVEIVPAPGVLPGLEWDEGAAGPRRRRFRGSFILSAANGSVVLVNRVSLEEYLAGVVGAEMPASSYPLSALEAQAVASRTYALFALLRAEDAGRRARFAAGESFQVYAGTEREHPRVLQAVRATAGEVLTYQGALFRAYFHAACGGRTASAARLFGEPAIAPLDGVECGACAGTPHASWEARFPAAAVEPMLVAWAAARGVVMGPLAGFEVAAADAEGRVSYVRVRHSRGSFEIQAGALRGLLAGEGAPRLWSAAFEVSLREGTVFFTGRGRGHGAGLCQVGASKLGATANHAEILARYYPGSALERLYGPAPAGD